MPQHPVVLEPRDIAAIRESAALALRDPLDWADRFYRHVFAARPGLKVLFADDLGPQQHKLLRKLAVLLETLDHIEEIEPRLQQLGAAHRIYGAKPAHYPIICQALIDTLAESGGVAFTRAHREAWRKLLGFVTSAMLRGAESGTG